jgi:preprotein translocase subunit Sec61beta
MKHKHIIIAVTVVTFAWIIRFYPSESKADFKIENTKEALKITVDPTKDPLKITADSRESVHRANMITFYHSENTKRIEISADGKVKVYGDYDEAALIFWRHVTKMFPAFKAGVCGSYKK